MHSAAGKAKRRGELAAAVRRTKRAASPFDPVVVEVVRRALRDERLEQQEKGLPV